MHFWTRLDTLLGTMTLVTNHEGLTHVLLPGQAPPPLVGRSLAPSSRQMAPFCEQFNACLAGTLERFELPLVLECTAFQRAVYEALQRIPFAETRSYREVAEAIGRPQASRAVGAANGRNLLPIVIPCHRVIAADGGLGGYSGGIEMKRRLLAHEADVRAGRAAAF